LASTTIDVLCTPLKLADVQQASLVEVDQATSLIGDMLELAS